MRNTHRGTRIRIIDQTSRERSTYEKIKDYSEDVQRIDEHRIISAIEQKITMTHIHKQNMSTRTRSVHSKHMSQSGQPPYESYSTVCTFDVSNIICDMSTYS